MNWNNPEERAALIERVGPDKYNKAIQQHFKDSTVDVVGGHAIRTVGSRFGTLYQVGSTGTAYGTLDAAKTYAEANPVALSDE